MDGDTVTSTWLWCEEPGPDSSGCWDQFCWNSWHSPTPGYWPQSRSQGVLGTQLPLVFRGSSPLCFQKSAPFALEKYQRLVERLFVWCVSVHLFPFPWAFQVLLLRWNWAKSWILMLIFVASDYSFSNQHKRHTKIYPYGTTVRSGDNTEASKWIRIIFLGELYFPFLNFRATNRIVRRIHRDVSDQLLYCKGHNSTELIITQKLSDDDLSFSWFKIPGEWRSITSYGKHSPNDLLFHSRFVFYF